MTVDVTSFGNTVVYLPLSTPETFENIAIPSLSLFELSGTAFVSSYNVRVGSQVTSYIASVFYPQSVYSSLSSDTLLVFVNHNIYDEKTFAILQNQLVTFNQTFSYTGLNVSIQFTVQYLVYDAELDDLLILLSTPYSVYMYSVNQNKVYTFKVPTSINSVHLGVLSVTLTGGHLVASTFSYTLSNTELTVNTYLLECLATYSDNVMKIINTQTYQIPLTTTVLGVKLSADDIQMGITCKSSNNYVDSQLQVLVIYALDQISLVGSLTVYNTVYELNTGTVVNNSSQTYSNLALFETGFYGMSGPNYYIDTSSSIPLSIHIIDQAVSVYSYYVISAIATLPYLLVIVYNMITDNYESNSNITFSFNSSIATPTVSIFIYSNIIYYPIKADTPVQYQNTYYVPVTLQLYQVSTSSMLTVEYDEIALTKDELLLSGVVKNLQTGEPVSGATVSVYEAKTVLGNQISVGDLLTQATTNSLGQFQIQYAYTPKSPQDANIVVTASQDPIIMKRLAKVLGLQPVPSYKQYQ